MPGDDGGLTVGAAGDAGAGVREGTTATPGEVARVDKTWLLAGVAGTVLVVDLLTKFWVTSSFALYQSVPVLGDFLRLTYTHNPGAAFGIHVGEGSRAFFLVLALIALGVLAYLYLVTPARDRLRLFAVALVSGGAVGNIIDRIRYERGVVDFLDIGVGTIRWPVFNVADMAVSVGAVLLLVSFYLEERDEHARREREGEGRAA